MVDDVERLNHERVIERSFYTNSGVERILSLLASLCDKS